MVTFVGRFIKIKCIDLLISALSKVENIAWRLNLIGDGPEKQKYKDIAQFRNVLERIEFNGVLNNSEVRSRLAATDLFVLPSRADGWGAVVNEALMSGVPAICSNYCGAADLIRPGFNGDLFDFDSVDSLTQVMRKWVSKGPLDTETREKIRRWSECISGRSVAGYFLRILEYLENNTNPKPVAPWWAS
jgi:glycosyltransferase involved in cell wall biosynthesis